MQIVLNQPINKNFYQIKLQNIDKFQNKEEKNHYSEISSVCYPVFNSLKSRAIPTKLERFEGCLLGGAIGDAFGAPLEKHPMKYIEQKFHGKLQHLLKTKDNIAEFTDDTQMTLFTIEGLTEAFLKYTETETKFYKEILKAYQNWYKTQTEEFILSMKNRGLMDIPELYQQKAPGNTCISALKTGLFGTKENPINDSAGNGGVMRVAPVGLLYKNDAKKAFEVATNIAALTHGNPNGYLPAGFLASLIAHIVQGFNLEEAITKSKDILKTYKNNEQLLNKIKLAENLFKENITEDEAINKIGSGWTGDEALAIALYSNLKHNGNFKKTIVVAANHDGDSDTTAAIAGNIAGLMCGTSEIPTSWSKSIQVRDLFSTYSRILSVLSDNV